MKIIDNIGLSKFDYGIVKDINQDNLESRPEQKLENEIKYEG